MTNLELISYAEQTADKHRLLSREQIVQLLSIVPESESGLPSSAVTSS